MHDVSMCGVCGIRSSMMCDDVGGMCSTVGGDKRAQHVGCVGINTMRDRVGVVSPGDCAVVTLL